MDKREVAYTEARTDIFREMLRAGAFDMNEPDRAEFVAATVRQIAPDHPDLSDSLTRKLTSEGMTAVYGDATMALAAARGRGVSGSQDTRAENRPGA
jgi:hypothetical protein